MPENGEVAMGCDGQGYVNEGDRTWLKENKILVSEEEEVG